MADTFASPTDLAARLQLGDAPIDADAATVLLETATGLIQGELGGQRLVAVADDDIVILGTTERWLDLPQRPVTAVMSVAIDGGDPITDYKVFGSRMFRSSGWASCSTEPAAVAVTYSHGYAAGAQELQTARAVCLAAAASAYSNPSGLIGERIDDYSAQWDAVAAHMSLPDHARRALQRAYGRRGGLVRIG